MEDRDSFAEKYNHCIDTEENSCSAVNVDYILMYNEGNSNMLGFLICVMSHSKTYNSHDLLSEKQNCWMA